MWLGLPPPPPLNPNLAEVLKIHCSAHEGLGGHLIQGLGHKVRCLDEECDQTFIESESEK